MLKTMERAVESSELGDVFPLPIDPSMDDGQRAEVSANDAAAMLSDGHGGGPLPDLTPADRPLSPTSWSSWKATWPVTSMR
ncbi:MAG: hypothetical protein AAF638_04670 [Pseudomonadota bacterium]